MKLRAKIIAVVVIALVICIGGTSIFMARLAKRRMLTANSSNVSSLGGVAQRELEAIMTEGHSYVMQRLFENMIQTPRLDSIRILTVEGVVVRSGIAGEAGHKVPGFEFPEEGLSTRQKNNSLVHLRAIKNRSECFACHGEAVSHIGVMELTYDISSGINEVRSTGNFLILAGILTVLIVSGTLIAIITRSVSYPLEMLKESINSVKEGNLGARASLQGNDELAMIGKSFNSMMVKIKDTHVRTLLKERDISRVKAELDHKVMLEELNTQLQHKVREVESANKAVLSLSKELKHKNVELEKMVDRLKRINEVGSILTSIIDLKELLKIIVKTASETLHAQKGTIHIAKTNSEPITLQYIPNAGFTETGIREVEIDLRFQDMLLEGRQVFQGNGSQDTHIGIPFKMKGQIIGGILLEGESEGAKITHDDLEILETMAFQAVVALENAWLYDTVKANYFGTIQSLVNALEASDRYTKGHSERVRALGTNLASYMGLDHRELEVFEHAAILHDIGKIGIDSTVLNKEGELTNTEFSLIRAHPIIGDEILGPIGTLEGVRTTILQHHERYDGKGYPYGISGEEITMKARILAVIDTFDAMLTDRPYRKALNIEKVLEEIRKGSGTQFDPAVVNAFLQMLRENEELMTNTGYAGR